jgi:hypothetical protein
LDKLVLVSGGITVAVGVGFIVAHAVDPYLSSAYVSGGIGALVIGTVMTILGKKISTKKNVEQMR